MDLRFALLCRSLLRACPELNYLFINTDNGASITVMKGLLAAQLGQNRIIRVHVPGK